MQGSTLKRRLNQYGTVFELVGTGGLSLHIWLAIEEFDQTSYPALSPWMLKHLTGYQNIELLGISLPILGLVVSAFLYILGFVSQRIRSTKDWKIIQYILDKAQEIAYPDQNGQDPKHFHRVTLFQYQKFARVHHYSQTSQSKVTRFIWPWGKMNPFSGWLVPVKRSAHTSKETRTRFAVLANGESEGICGKAWSNDNTLVIRNLPSVQPSNVINRRKYAEATNCCRQMIDYMLKDTGEPKTAPRSIGAIPVRVDGELWGMLVFDSQDPNGVSNTIEADFQVTVGAIEKLLEKK